MPWRGSRLLAEDLTMDPSELHENEPIDEACIVEASTSSPRGKRGGGSTDACAMGTPLSRCIVSLPACELCREIAQRYW